MPRFLLRLAVAILTFAVGLTTAGLFGAFSSPSPGAWEKSSFEVSPRKKRSCRMSLSELPPPPPPAPPAVSSDLKETRITVRRPDGTTRVIESRTENDVRSRF